MTDLMRGEACVDGVTKRLSESAASARPSDLTRQRDIAASVIPPPRGLAYAAVASALRVVTAYVNAVTSLR
jgi:hypothetical protein